MLKQTLDTVGVNVPLNIPDVPGISFLATIYTTSTSDMPHLPTYEHLHRHFLPKKDGNNEFVTYKKYFMSLITIVSSTCQLGRPNLTQLYSLFEEDVIYLYNEFKLEWRYYP